MKKFLKQSLAVIICLLLIFTSAPLQGLTEIKIPIFSYISSLMDSITLKASAASYSVGEYVNFAGGYLYGSVGVDSTKVWKEACGMYVTDTAYSYGGKTYIGLRYSSTGGRYGWAESSLVSKVGNSISTNKSSILLYLDSSPTTTITVYTGGSFANLNYTSSTSYCTVTNPTWSGDNCTFTITGTAEGSTTLHFKLLNDAGETLVSTTNSLTVAKSKYTVSFNANGGSGAPSSQTKYYNQNLTLSSTTPSRSGYSFLGWSTSSSATSASYKAGSTYSKNASATLYAVWKDSTKPTCSISSTNNVATSQTVTLTIKDNVGAVGYYWGTSSTYSSNTYTSITSTTSTTITKTVSSAGTYYLTVKDSTGNVSTTASKTFYKTTLNANSGSVSPSYVITMSGNSFTLPTPTRSGFTYTGWNTNSSGSGTAYSTGATYKPTSSATIYAQWKDSTKPTCSISSTNNVATSQTVTLTIKDNVGAVGYYWGTSSTYSSNTYTSITSTTSTTITKTVSSAGTYYLTVKDSTGNVSTTASKTFYKTTLNANSGSVSPSYVITMSGNSFTLPTPTRSGFTYTGWNTNSSGSGTAYSTGATYKPTSSATIYAQWKDSTKPTCSISSTNNVATSQTVTLTIKDNVGAVGYYWGTSSTYSSNTYTSITSTTSTTITKTVSSEGTYYLTVKDSTGNVSTTASKTFYKTTLNANNGSVSPSYVITMSGNSFTLPTPTRSGFASNGWGTSSSSNEVKYTNKITPTSSETIYAIWSDSGKPTGSISSTNNVATSQTVTLTIKDNVGAVGYYWGTSSTYSSNTYTSITSTTSTTITKTVSSVGTYYLTVKDSTGNISTTVSKTFYKTTLNANSGSVSPSYVITMSGNSFTLPTPTREGFLCVGWSNSDNSLLNSNTEFSPVSNIELSASWEDVTCPTCSISCTNDVATSQTVTLTIKDNVGAVGYYWGTSSIYSSNTYTSITSTTSTTITKTVSSANKYYFTVKDSAGNLSTTVSVTLYKIVLDANGGSVTPSYEIIVSGNSFSLPTPKREGFTFIGWNTESSGNGTAYSIGTAYKANSSKTLYAQWKDIAKPTGSITSTNNVAASQTVTLTVKDNVNVIGYYWGTNPTYSGNTYTSISATIGTSLTKLVSSAGTYYLTVKDSSDNLSETYSIVLLQTDFDAGSGSTKISSVITQKNAKITLPDASLKHFEHIGWSSKPNSKTAEYTETYEVNSPGTLYAVYISNMRCVKFDANTGLGAPGEIEYDYTEGTVLSDSIPTKSYKISFNPNGGTVDISIKNVFCGFDSWNTLVDGSGESYKVGSYYSSQLSATLYAQWTNSAAEDLPTPMANRKKFLGWYTEQGTKVDSKTIIQGDLTVYAHWADVNSYTISYDLNGGVGRFDSQTLYENEVIILFDDNPTKDFTITYHSDGDYLSLAKKTIHCSFCGWQSGTNVYDAGSRFSEYQTSTLVAQWKNPSIGKLAETQKEGFNFVGWYTENGELVSESTLIDSDIDLYANWSEIKTFLVTYDANGGTNAPQAQIKFEGSNLTITKQKPDKSVSITYNANGGNCTKSELILNCSFKEWADGNGRTYLPNSTYSTDSDAVLSAVWNDTLCGSLEVPQKEGYQFDGWYTDISGGTLVTSSTVIDSDIEIFAHWTPNQYQINFYDGNKLIYKKSMNYDEPSQLDCQEIPTKDGYEFLGWAEKEGDTSRYNNNDKVINLTKENNGIVSLYASWLKYVAFDDLTYSFINNRDGYNGKNGFKYDEKYYIGLDAYRNAFGQGTLASKLYDYDVNILGNLWGGNCYGMSSSSLMFNSPQSSGMRISDFNIDAFTVSDLALSDVNPNVKYINFSGVNGYNKKETDMSLQNYIEIMQVSQKCEYIQADYRNNKNKLNDLCDLIIKSKKTGKYPVIAIFGAEGGHAIVGYDIIDISETESHICIYDSNYPEIKRYISLTKGRDGNYTGWSYNLSDSMRWGSDKDGSWISYVPYEDLEYVWIHRGDSSKLSKKSTNIMMIDSLNYSIKDIAGFKVCECVNGEFVSYDADIFKIIVAEMNSSDTGLVMLPTDVYTISNNDTKDKNFSVTMLNSDLGASISTTASEIQIEVDDLYDLNSVFVNTKTGDDFNIELYSTMDNGYNSVVLKGKGTGSAINVNGKSIETGNNNISVCTINGIDYTDHCQIKKPISINIQTKPDKTAYIYKIDKSLDKTGLSIRCDYNDGTSEIITDLSSLNCSGYDSKKVGTQAIKVVYGNFNTSFNVTVSYTWWQMIIRIFLLGLLWY